ncbi:hypothetical protein F5882DRAFT_21835 [Hyaloscypha sp. PMI_1271]|nr:hypothetical protein F5882DRAFT_21835 [Hyaloscypha sp. PMI_1271]
MTTIEPAFRAVLVWFWFEGLSISFAGSSARGCFRIMIRQLRDKGIGNDQATSLCNHPPAALIPFSFFQSIHCLTAMRLCGC